MFKKAKLWTFCALLAGSLFSVPFVIRAQDANLEGTLSLSENSLEEIEDINDFVHNHTAQEVGTWLLDMDEQTFNELLERESALHEETIVSEYEYRPEEDLTGSEEPELVWEETMEYYEYAIEQAMSMPGKGRVIMMQNSGKYFYKFYENGNSIGMVTVDITGNTAANGTGLSGQSTGKTAYKLTVAETNAYTGGNFTLDWNKNLDATTSVSLRNTYGYHASDADASHQNFYIFARRNRFTKPLGYTATYEAVRPENKVEGGSEYTKGILSLYYYQSDFQTAIKNGTIKNFGDSTSPAKTEDVLAFMNVAYLFGDENGDGKTAYKPQSGPSYKINFVPIQYKINFKSDQTLLSQLGCSYNSDITLAKAPVKAGYHFDGWTILGKVYGGEQKVIKANFAAEQAAQIDAVANWSANQYTIVYSSEGGSSVANTSCVYGQDVKLAAAPNRQGYQFLGWKIADKTYSAGETVRNLTTQEHAMVSATALWKANPYYIRYDSMGGTPVERMEYLYDENGSLAEAPTRDGYVFGGWRIGSNIYEAGQEVKNIATGGEVLAEAVWRPKTYNVSYDRNGATEGTTPSQDGLLYDGIYTTQANGFIKSVSITLDADGGETENSVLTLYSEFKGWNTMADGSGSFYKENDTFSRLGQTEDNVILYAQWDDNQAYCMLPAANKADTNKILPDGSSELTKYTFAGWQDAKGSIYEAGSYFAPAANVTLTATYKMSTQVLAQGQNQGHPISISLGNVTYEIVAGEDGNFLIQYAATQEKKIYIPDTVTVDGQIYRISEISNKAFYQNSSIEEVELGKNIVKIGDSAFQDCKNLKKVTFGENLAQIGNYAFAKDTALTALAFPKSLKDIGNYSFYQCEKIAKISFEEGLLSIGDYAFAKCVSLTGIKLPNSLLKMGIYVFSDCKKLASATFGEGLTTIGKAGFIRCTQLKNAAFKKNLTTIPAKCFYACKNLQSVSFKNKVTTIGTKAFYKCEKLNKVKPGSGITTIKASAFEGCKKLSGITLTKKVMTIEKKAFYNCKSLKNVNIKSKVLSKVGDSAFKKCKKGMLIRVPSSKQAAYSKLLKNKYTK